MRETRVKIDATDAMRQGNQGKHESADTLVVEWVRRELPSSLPQEAPLTICHPSSLLRA